MLDNCHPETRRARHRALLAPQPRSDARLDGHNPMTAAFPAWLGTRARCSWPNGRPAIATRGRMPEHGCPAKSRVAIQIRCSGNGAARLLGAQLGAQLSSTAVERLRGRVGSRTTPRAFVCALVLILVRVPNLQFDIILYNLNI